jgi:hypothetical protein
MANKYLQKAVKEYVQQYAVEFVKQDGLTKKRNWLVSNLNLPKTFFSNEQLAQLSELTREISFQDFECELIDVCSGASFPFIDEALPIMQQGFLMLLAGAFNLHANEVLSASQYAVYQNFIFSCKPSPAEFYNFVCEQEGSFQESPFVVCLQDLVKVVAGAELFYQPLQKLLNKRAARQAGFWCAESEEPLLNVRTVCSM